MKLAPPIPILRILDEAKALEFYIGFLGFSIDWEHRFGDNTPLYLQVSRDGCVLHLSEHYGDATPGGALRIETNDVDGLNRELGAILAENDVKERFAGFGGVPAHSTPEAMRARVEREIARWQRVVETRGIERQ